MGETAIGFKPVASGTQLCGGELRNLDAHTLQQASSFSPPYDMINPYCFQEHIAPHLAARHENIGIELSKMVQAYQKLEADYAPDCIIVEGAGGWRVPYSDELSQVDLVRALDIPVLLVVGMRLGCLNHATLSWEVLKQDGVQTLGWVANYINPNMQAQAENLKTLIQLLGEHPLGQQAHHLQILA